MKTFTERTVRLCALALVSVGLANAPFGSASADEKLMSAVCGSGYGGSFVDPYYTAYTTSSPCASKYLSCTIWLSGTPYTCGTAWSANNIEVDLNPADSVVASHRICNDTQTICSLWAYTADS